MSENYFIFSCDPSVIGVESLHQFIGLIIAAGLFAATAISFFRMKS